MLWFLDEGVVLLGVMSKYLLISEKSSITPLSTTRNNGVTLTFLLNLFSKYRLVESKLIVIKRVGRIFMLIESCVKSLFCRKRVHADRDSKSFSERPNIT